MKTSDATISFTPRAQRPPCRGLFAGFWCFLQTLQALVTLSQSLQHQNMGLNGIAIVGPEWDCMACLNEIYIIYSFGPEWDCHGSPRAWAPGRFLDTSGPLGYNI